MFSWRYFIQYAKVWMAFLAILEAGVAWFLIGTQTDLHWSGTLLAFGPRYLLLVPVGIGLAIVAIDSVMKFRAVVPAIGLQERVSKNLNVESRRDSRKRHETDSSLNTWSTIGILVFAGMLVIGPVMGFCLPWKRSLYVF